MKLRPGCQVRLVLSPGTNDPAKAMSGEVMMLDDRRAHIRLEDKSVVTHPAADHEWTYGADGIPERLI